MTPSVRWGIRLALAIALIAAGHGPVAGQNQCAAGAYTYTFTNSCSQTIFVGQNSQSSSSTPPSLPEAGNWALAPACTASNQASVCTGTNSTCSVPVGQMQGQCTCTKDTGEHGSELVEGFGAGQPLPVRLVVQPGASPDKATFATPPGVTPHARMRIERKQLEGRHAFSLVIEQISIRRARACGPRPGPSDKASLTTRFTLEAAVVVVTADARWKCRDGSVYRVGR